MKARHPIPRFLRAALGLVVVSCASFVPMGASPPEADDSGDPQLPNIVLINADDVGYGDVGC